MLVDDRIANKLLENDTNINEVDASTVILYRSYLYTLQPTNHMIVRIRNQMYIRFPVEYNVIRNASTKFKVGLMVHSNEKYRYATCFNTRTYSCLHYNQRLRADSEEMINWIKQLNQKNNSILWPSTNDLTQNCQKFVYQDIDSKVLFSMRVGAVIFKDARDKTDILKIKEQKQMWTLPDVFIKEPTNEEKMLKFVELCSENVNTDTWIIDLNQDNLQESVITARCTTKRFAHEEKRLVDYAATNFDNPLLKKILPTIYKNTGIPSFIDKR